MYRDVVSRRGNKLLHRGRKNSAPFKTEMIHLEAGWGDGTVGKTLASRAWGLEFE